MRCLTLANALHEKGIKTHFLCREHAGHLLELIHASGHGVCVLPASESFIVKADTAHAAWLGTTQDIDARDTCEILKKLRPTWLVVDHYALDFSWEQQVQSFCQKILVIDDLADRKHLCTILLDQNWYGSNNERRYQSLLRNNTIQLLGPKYALLRPEYRKERSRLTARNETVRQILVFMGGSDPSEATELIMEELSSLKLNDIKIKIVIGINYPNTKRLISKFGKTNNWEILQNIPSLAPLMSHSDLMIGAGGSTNWERMCLGLPSVILSVAENQVKACEQLALDGYINYIGKLDQTNIDKIGDIIELIIDQPNLRRTQSIKMMSMVDGFGTERVCTSLIEGFN